MAGLIREAENRDRPTIDRFMTELNRIEAAMGIDRDVSPTACRRHIDYLYDVIGERGGFCIVAEVDGELAGFLLATIEEADGYFVPPGKRRFVWVSDLYVEEAHRRQGHARALLAEAANRTRRAGIRSLRLGVICGNEAAEETYRRFGFQPMELVMDLRIT